jgi:hypothetical protein
LGAIVAEERGEWPDTVLLRIKDQLYKVYLKIERGAFFENFDKRTLRIDDYDGAGR